VLLACAGTACYATGVRTAALRAVVFDVGNTLLHLDYDFVADFLGGHGHRATPMEIRRAEYAAKAAIDAELARVAAPGDGAEELVSRPEQPSYFATVLAHVGVAATEQPPLLEALRAHHRDANLWRVVDPDATPVLETLRARGFSLAVVSNADGRVEADLERNGLRRHFAAVIDSHVVGVEKPDPAIFRLALAHLGAAPEQAVHVGDMLGPDVRGARSAGMAAVLLDPLGAYPGPIDCPRVQRLVELLDLLPEQAVG